MTKKHDWEQCRKCPYWNNCPENLNEDKNLNVCILNILKEKNFKEDSPEMFMFKNHPELLLKYLTFLRRDKLPTIGTEVYTLRAGFSGPAGVIRVVSFVSDKEIQVETPSGTLCLSEVDSWYNDFFVLDENN